MASLQELKNRLSGKSSQTTQTEKIDKKSLQPESPKTPIFEVGEARYLLALIAKSEFSGKDIQIVYDSALKLQEIIKNNLDTNG